MFVAQEGDKNTKCLKHSGIDELLSMSSCFYSDDTLGFRYSDITGQISVGSTLLSTDINQNQVGLCIAYVSQGNYKLRNCNMEKTEQRWIYYNAQFYLSSDSSMKLVISNID